MGNQIANAPHRNDLVTFDQALQQADLINLYASAPWHYPEGLPEWLKRAERVDLAAAERALAVAAQPATTNELKANLAVLVGSFPNATKAPLEIYGRALAMDVAEMNPSRCALMRACRKLRREQNFLPTINEVLDEIENQEQRLNSEARALEALPSCIEQARKGITIWREQQREELANCVRRLGDGKSVSFYRPELVAEAQAQIDRENDAIQRRLSSEATE